MRPILRFCLRFRRIFKEYCAWVESCSSSQKNSTLKLIFDRDTLSSTGDMCFAQKKCGFKFEKMRVISGSSTMTRPYDERLPLEIGYRLISYIMELFSAHNLLYARPAFCEFPEKPEKRLKANLEMHEGMESWSQRVIRKKHDLRLRTMNHILIDPFILCRFIIGLLRCEENDSCLRAWASSASCAGSIYKIRPSYLSSVGQPSFVVQLLWAQSGGGSGRKNNNSLSATKQSFQGLHVLCHFAWKANVITNSH